MNREIIRKENRGITLIALVITIIVLLILAGVAIASLTGENGILNRAGQASDNTKRQSFIEQAQLAVLNKEVLLNGKTLTNDDLKDALKQYFTIPSDLDLTKTENKDVELTPNATNGYGPFASAITVKDVLGNIRTAGGGGGGDTPTTGSLPTPSDIGDYVTGDVVSLGIAGTTGAVSSNGNEWRIFYTTASGTYIIASDYVPNTNSTLSTAMTNAGMVVGIGSYTAKWSTVPSPERYDETGNGATFLNAWDAIAYDNAKCTSKLINTTAWSGFANGISGALAIGSPTLELYRASWNAQQEAGNVDTKLQITKRTDINPYGYYVTANNDDTATASTAYVDISGDAGYNNPLYYPHKDGWNSCCGYWLASPSAYVGTYVMGVDRGYLLYYLYNNTSLGLRPLVYLPSSVQLTEDDNVWRVTK